MGGGYLQFAMKIHGIKGIIMRKTFGSCFFLAVCLLFIASCSNSTGMPSEVIYTAVKTIENDLNWESSKTKDMYTVKLDNYEYNYLMNDLTGTLKMNYASYNCDYAGTSFSFLYDNTKYVATQSAANPYDLSVKKGTSEASSSIKTTVGSAIKDIIKDIWAGNYEGMASVTAYRHISNISGAYSFFIEESVYQNGTSYDRKHYYVITDVECTVRYYGGGDWSKEYTLDIKDSDTNETRTYEVIFTPRGTEIPGSSSASSSSGSGGGTVIV